MYDMYVFELSFAHGPVAFALRDVGRDSPEDPAICPKSAKRIRHCFAVWLWINTYENTIFRGMNIHFNPAIFM